MTPQAGYCFLLLLDWRLLARPTLLHSIAQQALLPCSRYWYIHLRPYTIHWMNTIYSTNYCLLLLLAQRLRVVAILNRSNSSRELLFYFRWSACNFLRVCMLSLTSTICSADSFLFLEQGSTGSTTSSGSGQNPPIPSLLLRFQDHLHYMTPRIHLLLRM